MPKGRILQATVILVSSGGANFKAGIVLMFGSRGLIPEIADLPGILEEINRFELDGKIVKIGEYPGYLVYQPIGVSSSDIMELADSLADGPICPDCALNDTNINMMDHGKYFFCIKCGTHLAKI